MDRAGKCTARQLMPEAPSQSSFGPASVNRSTTLGLRPATTWPKEIPQDQTEQRQEHHHQNPKQLLFVGSGTLSDVDHRPDIASKYEQSPKTVVSDGQHYWILPFCDIVAASALLHDRRHSLARDYPQSKSALRNLRSAPIRGAISGQLTSTKTLLISSRARLAPGKLLGGADPYHRCGGSNCA